MALHYHGWALPRPDHDGYSQSPSLVSRRATALMVGAGEPPCMSQPQSCAFFRAPEPFAVV